MHKKIPPFGKKLADLQAEGLRPFGSIFLIIGITAWQHGKAKAISYPLRTLILPAYECPFSYFWPVKECDVLILDYGYPELDYIDELAYALYEYKAEIVRYLSPDEKLTVFYKE